MSGPDQGDDDKREDKGFLARWSHRKQEANRSEQDVPVAKPAGPSVPAPEADVEPEFDLSDSAFEMPLAETKPSTVSHVQPEPEVIARTEPTPESALVILRAK